MLLRRVVWIALVPAVALAAPKGHKPPKGTTKPADTSKPADTPKPADAPADTPKPADAPATGDKPAATPPGGAPATPTDKPAEAPAEAEKPTPPPAKGDVDVDSLRQEYLALRDELFKSRARANAVASQLYSTRISIKMAWDSGRYYGVSKASIRLDGAVVYEDSKGAIAADDGVRFDGYVAPGRHVLTFHIDAAGKDDDSFTSSTETQVSVKAVNGKDLVVAAKAKDSGDIAYEWKKSEHGKYGLGIDVAVKTLAREGGKK
jgi:hypothetical protein